MFCIGFSFIIVCAIGTYYTRFLSVSELTHGDEYYTLDRATAFERHKDYLTVYSLNRPAFQKPPLQYWISGWLLKQGIDREIALRLPSFVAGILLLIVTGVSAYYLSISNICAVPLAIILLSSSSFFWTYSISAMLDAGATLFFTVSIIAALLAIYQPKWWYLVAAAIGLGAWQKSPLAFVAVGAVILIMMALNKWRNVGLSCSLISRHFYISAGLAVALILLWPIIQSMQHGTDSVLNTYDQEILKRIAPGDKLTGASAYKVIFDDEVWIRLAGILSLLSLPLVYRRVEFAVLIFLFIGFALIMVSSSGPLWSRYGLIFLPLLMASLAAALVGARPIRLFCAIPFMVIVFWLGEPFKNSAELGYLKGGQKYMPLLENVGAMLQEEETLLVCGRQPIYPGAASYFASNGRPFEIIDSADHLSQKEKRGLHPPYRGICLASKFNELKGSLSSYSIIRKAQGFIHWTSP